MPESPEFERDAASDAENVRRPIDAVARAYAATLVLALVGAGGAGWIAAATADMGWVLVLSSATLGFLASLAVGRGALVAPVLRRAGSRLGDLSGTVSEQRALLTDERERAFFDRAIAARPTGEHSP